jgi:carbonic anhydrase
MKKLIAGIVNFRKELTQEKKDLFARLALQQKPDAFLLTCSDSRLVPDLFASTDPGDLFVLRNVGNFIPPNNSKACDSAAAALEFAVLYLEVSNIIICGHSECGAIQLLLNEKKHCCDSYLHSWLKNGKEIYDKKPSNIIINSKLSQQNQLSQYNVLNQIEHVKTYSFVQEKINQKKLQVYGWWFDIEHADVYCYEQALKCFTLIDEEEAKSILKRL